MVFFREVVGEARICRSSCIQNSLPLNKVSHEISDAHPTCKIQLGTTGYR